MLLAKRRTIHRFSIRFTELTLETPSFSNDKAALFWRISQKKTRLYIKSICEINRNTRDRVSWNAFKVTQYSVANRLCENDTPGETSESFDLLIKFVKFAKFPVKFA